MNLWSRFLICLSVLAALALVGLATLSPPTVAASEVVPVAVDEPEEPVAEAELWPDPWASRPPAAAAIGSSPARKGPSPLDAALALGDAEYTAQVAVGAIRRGDLGASLLACLDTMNPEARREVKEKAGVDLFEAVERVSAAGELVGISGRFAGAHFEKMDQQPVTPYGDRAKLYGQPSGEGETVALWNDELMLVGSSRAEVIAAIDRVEGRAPPKGVPKSLYGAGEIHGRVPLGDLLKEMPVEMGAREMIRDALGDAKVEAEYHISVVDGGLQVSVKLLGANGQEALDTAADVLESGLGSLRASLGVAMEAPTELNPAATDGMPPLAAIAEMLKTVRVNRGPNGVSVDADVPASLLRQAFSFCQAPASEAASEAAVDDASEVALD